jgi:hypothetical protein
MGEAFTAVADDATALVWNPAGLAQVDQFEFQFMHNRWLGDFSHEYFGAAFPAAGTFAVAYSALNLGTYDEFDGGGARTGRTFTASDQAVVAGFGRALFDGTLLLGAASKLIKEDLGGGITGRAMSLDAGALAIPWRQLSGARFGAVVQNLGGELSGFSLPLALRLGASWRVAELLMRREADATAEPGPREAGREIERYPWEADSGGGDAATFTAECVVPRNGHLEVHGGAEYWVSFAAARVGYRYRYPRNELGGPSGLTVGLGLRGRSFQFDFGFDFAYAPYGDLGDASRFSFLVAF